jgi:hypothetical protein
MGDGGISRIVRFGGPGGSTPGTGGGGAFSGDAQSIRTVNVNPGAPGDNAVIVKPAGSTEYVPSQLSMDQILPGFDILTFSAPGGLAMVEIGTNVAAKTLAATFAGGLPSVVTLTDTDGNSRDVSSTPTAPAELASHLKTVNGASLAWTLTATRNGITKTKGLGTLLWGTKVYFGKSASSGPYDAAFIASLASTLKTSRAGSYSYSYGAGEKPFLCMDNAVAAFMGPTFKIGGFTYTLDLVASTVNVTSNGVTRPYDVYSLGPAASGATSLILDVS